MRVSSIGVKFGTMGADSKAVDHRPLPSVPKGNGGQMQQSSYTTKRNPYQAYRRTQIETATKEQLLIMLYDGAIRFLNQAVAAVQTKDMRTKATTVDKALAIVQHLSLTLDTTQGKKVADELDRLYDYVTEKIVEGSGKLQTKEFQEAIKVLTILRSGWAELAEREAVQTTVPPELLAQQAAGPGLTLRG